jgi:ABC-type glycerol-3-phosphate transport system permease component
MNKRRKFTPEFKSQVVLQLLSGERIILPLVALFPFLRRYLVAGFTSGALKG